LGVGASPLCLFCFQLDPQSRWPFTPLIPGFVPWSSEGTKVTTPVDVYMFLRFNVIVKHTQICVDLSEIFLKLELPAGFMSLVFQIFVLLVLLAPSLNLLSPDVGVSQMQCGKAVQCANRFGLV